MKEKILAYLKTKLNGFAGGIQDSFLEGIADTYSKTILAEAQITTDITDVQLELIKTAYTQYQSNLDSRTKDALKKFREKHGLDENGLPLEDKKDKDKNKKIVDPNEPEWAKTLRESMEKQSADLQKKIDAYEVSKKREGYMTTLSKKLVEKGVDEDLIPVYTRNLILESEENVETLVGTIEADYKALVQKKADKGVVLSIPRDSQGKNEVGELSGKNIAEKRNTQKTDGIPGKTV